MREIERDVERTFGGLAWFSGEPDRDGSKEEDALWKRIALLEEVEHASAEELSKDSAPPSADMPPPSLSLLPPPESGEAERNVSIPVTPTTPTTPTVTSRPPFPVLHPRTRRQALLRPLYIYATLNPGVSYVQGMNSIVAVFVYIFATGGSNSLDAEAAAFFALGAALSQLRDLYVRSLDDTISPLPSFSSTTPHITPTGLGATLQRFTSLLTWLDPTLAASLHSKELDPAMYVFKWLTTLFATSFELPDLVRIWDRLIALFPADTEPAADEALTPILGHLLDLSLALVLLERPTLVSPFANFQKCLAMLQDPQVEGEAVDKLLGIAWEIRERRLGKTKRVSTADAGNWRSAASRWSTAATKAAVAASSGPAASSFRQRFWTPTSAPTNARTPSNDVHAGDYDLDDSASVAESDTSAATAPPLFASRGQRIDFEEAQRARAASLGEFARNGGKSLPPPPGEVEGRARGEVLVRRLPPPPSVDEEELEELEEEKAEGGGWGAWKNSLSRLRESDAAASLAKRTTNFSLAASLSASSLSQSTSRIGSSDAAASLSKATTNLSIQAQLLRDRVAEQGPEQLARIKENVAAAAAGRFLSSPRVDGTPPRRPGSPVAEPFTPPRWGDSPGMGRRPVSPAPFGTPEGSLFGSADMGRGGSGGPKPLLLSGAARRAGSGSTDSVSPPGSKRNSIIWRSPTPTTIVSPSFTRSPPTLHSDLVVAPLGIARTPSRGSHARAASQASTPPRLHASAFHTRSASATSPPRVGLEDEEDVPIESRRLQERVTVSPVGETSPTVGRLRRSVNRTTSTDSTSSAVRALDGRGWSLSDAPVRARPAPLDFSVLPELSTEQIAYASPLPSPPASFASTSEARPLSPVSDVSSAPQRRSTIDVDAPPSGTAFVPPTETPFRPPRKSSLAHEEAEEAPLRSKISRRPLVGRKRATRSSTGSISSSADFAPPDSAAKEGRYASLSDEKRRSVSSFLVGGEDDGSSTGSLGKRGSQHRRRLSRQGAGGKEGEKG